ncbi:MAG: hypothetical protein EZS28_000329 [Streblomastix strix]|uniref:START domain-containing protein n=1 Tax=Streblomastix strix TaxID=222440 RepID=A0A5J4XAK9_9EUKA|nr:MAG: hypothetical protein EZS28_000329 [Streblomastix strix]
MAEKGLDLAQADKDWEYLKQIADNPTSTGWKEEKNNKNDGVIVYSRVCDDQAKNIIEFRGDGEVDASVQLCSDIVNDADSRVKWETTMENYHILWRGENGYHACYNQSKSVIGGVISSRDFITLNVIRPTESGVVISAGSSTNAKLIDEKPGVVRGWCYPCGWIMTPINENKTKIIYIMRSDLKDGAIPVDGQ